MIQKPNSSSIGATIPMDNVERSVQQVERPRWLQLLTRYRLPVLIVAHVVIFCGIYWIALAFRFESFFPKVNPKLLWFGMPFVAGLKLAIFLGLRNFRGWWRYVTFSDLVGLGRAAVVSMVALIVIDYFALPGFQIPRSVIVVDCAITIAVLAALRSTWRIWDERLSGITNQNRNRRRALLVGCDIESAKLAHLINSKSNLNVRVVGLISPEPGKSPTFSGLKVMGNATQNIAEICRLNRVKTVYIPTGMMSGKNLRDLVEEAGKSDLVVHVVPRIGSLLEGGAKIPLRPVRFEDLLRRESVNLDKTAIQNLVSGRVVLVTGAGGSIGSEICRQLIQFGPAKLVLLGRGENRLFHLHNELKEHLGATDLVAALVNITDRERVEQIFQIHQPEIVFHAAAHKHVPLIENNVGEGIVNNVLGSMTVADVADQCHVKDFVLVSTDKAVRPTSVMGCTKQLAERYCLALGSQSNTRFLVTRFGNVLGSEGSVIPVFQRQIQRGGPVTVTDPDMERFFMTIPEAAQLVLQAATMSKGGEIFVLEMGEPVKIVDLARDLIGLAGLSGDAIEIVYTGIRPGEKLYEELYDEQERPIPTSHNQILSAYCRNFELQEVRASLEHLISMKLEPAVAIKTEIKKLIPEYSYIPPQPEQVKSA